MTNAQERMGSAAFNDNSGFIYFPTKLSPRGGSKCGYNIFEEDK